jgi:hypothetical protein
LRDYQRVQRESAFVVGGPINSAIKEHYFNGAALPEPIWQVIDHVQQYVPNTFYIGEMRTILGAPNTLNDFIEGDDISENLFRCSLNQQHVNATNKHVYMRYGHSDVNVGTNSDGTIRNAHGVVLNVANVIHPASTAMWGIVKNGAIAP